MEKLSIGLLWYSIFLFSTVCHEASHALAAMLMGDRTAYEGGQVSLNPVPHIRREPLGMVLFPLLSFFTMGWTMGWASTPFSFSWALAHPRRSGWMSLAGPFSNLMLAVLAGLLIHLGIAFDIFYAPESIHYSVVVAAKDPGMPSAFATLLSVLFSLNLLMFLFNLLPLPPLDGSGALTVLLDEGLARKYLQLIHHPSLQFLSFFVAWQIFNVIFHPLHLIAINLLYPSMGYH